MIRKILKEVSVVFTRSWNLLKAFLLLEFSLFVCFVFGYANEYQMKVLNTANKMVGGSYGWGAYDPENRVFDCWNFATWVYHTALDEPGSVEHMIIGRNDLIWVYFDDHRVLHKGDLLFNGGGHTVGFHAGIYVGNGKTVEARGGSYGINYFDIRGSNKYDPRGWNGYRFCFYSLLVRLWLNPTPTFYYVFFDEPESFVVRGDEIKLNVRYFAFPFMTGTKIRAEMVDYMTDIVLGSTELEIDIWELKEKSVTVGFDTSEIDNKFVYFRVQFLSGSRILFSYDSKILKYTNIIG